MSVYANFGVISDIYCSTENESNVHSRLQSAIDYFESHNSIQSIILLGDTICTNTNNQSKNKRVLLGIHQILQQADLHVHFICGDKDIKQTSKEYIQSHMGHTAGIRKRFVGIDTAWHTQHGVYGKANVSVLESNQPIPEKSFIFSHHPLVPWNLSTNWFSERPELAYAINKHNVWNNYIRDSNPKLVMNGHIREQKSQFRDGILCFSTRPFNGRLCKPHSLSGHFYSVSESKHTLEISEHIALINSTTEKITTQKFDTNEKTRIQTKPEFKIEQLKKT